jgi:hypothetical protein
MSIPTATFMSFLGLDHKRVGYSADLVVPHVKKFLAEVGEG